MPHKVHPHKLHPQGYRPDLPTRSPMKVTTGRNGGSTAPPGFINSTYLAIIAQAKREAKARRKAEKNAS